MSNAGSSRSGASFTPTRRASLIEQGSRQDSLWGGNYHPELDEEECIEYESLINIRPASGNPGLEVQNPAIRATIRAVVFSLIGSGRPHP
ncbi:MAG: hypothetical protein HOP15_14520 [Planctomycetes bacterium]|nr:hypothetical protein [Planctomycetota bacterium]